MSADMPIAKPAVPSVVEAPQPVHQVTTSTTQVEVPYLDYPREHGQAFIVDHYKLGDTWANREYNFVDEVNTLEAYFREQVESGAMENSTTAVKNKLKEIEKITNTSHETRPAYKLGTIAAYVKFLIEADDIKHNIKRYGS